ncbi:MAG: bacillithiol system redox-active protein YtxJ [Bacteroidota bacterium]
MAWKNLQDVSGVEAIVTASQDAPQLIFKHSTRCGISSGAKRRLEGGLADLAEKFELHYLDLLTYRPVSNHIATALDVRHQSPQIIALHKGKPIFDMSHYEIEPARILQLLEKAVGSEE